MKRTRLWVCSCLAVLMASIGMVRSAYAIKPFKEEFEKMYVKATPATDEEKKLAEAVDAAKCNVCHVGENKKMRNTYGQALSKLITKKDGKETEKIKKALEDVAKQHSDPNDDKSPTFGELISKGSLPAGA